MTDEEIESQFETIRRLKHISDRFHEASAKRYPVPEKVRKRMRKGLEAEWENRQRKSTKEKQDADEKDRVKAQAKTQEQAAKQTQSKTKGQSH